MLPFSIFVFKLFYEIYEEFLVYFIVKTSLAINEKSENFWHGVNDKVWGVWGSVGEGVEVVRKCEEECGLVLGRCGEGVR